MRNVLRSTIRPTSTITSMNSSLHLCRISTRIQIAVQTTLAKNPTIMFWKLVDEPVTLWTFSFSPTNATISILNIRSNKIAFSSYHSRQLHRGHIYEPRQLYPLNTQHDIFYEKV